MVRVAVHGADEASGFRDDVMHVWHEVFGAVEDAADWRETVWERHRARADFRLGTAHDSDELIGFSWGYTGEPGQFWSDLIIDKLGPLVADWVGGHFEFVELAVLSPARGRGTGGRLHDALLSGLPHQRALLGTADDSTSPAVRLYQSRGWRHLGKQASHDQVMGKLLHPERSAKPDAPSRICDHRSAKER